MDDTLASPSQFMARTAHSVTFLATPYVSPPTVAAVCVPWPAVVEQGQSKIQQAYGSRRPTDDGHLAQHQDQTQCPHAASTLQAQEAPHTIAVIRVVITEHRVAVASAHRPPILHKIFNRVSAAQLAATSAQLLSPPASHMTNSMGRAAAQAPGLACVLNSWCVKRMPVSSTYLRQAHRDGSLGCCSAWEAHQHAAQQQTMGA